MAALASREPPIGLGIRGGIERLRGQLRVLFSPAWPGGGLLELMAQETSLADRQLQQ